MGAPMWNPEQDRILFEGRRNSERFEDIAVKVGRSAKACRARYAERNLRPTSTNDRFCAEANRIASEKLRNRILAMFERMPAADIIEIIGPVRAKAPGTERIHKTSSIERMAA